MQCPTCDNEVDDAAFFCPQCRYQFRDLEETIPQELRTEDTLFEDDGRFSRKELKQLEIQLLQPSLFIVLLVSGGTYLLIAPLQELVITVAGMIIALAGAVAFITGMSAGLLFFFLARRSVQKFRSS